MISKAWIALGLLLPLSGGGAAWAGDPFLGKEVYVKHCVKCHGQKGRGEMPGMPDFTWKGIDRNGLSRPDPQLVARIKVGKGICPSFHGILNDMDIMNVVTYLRTLR